MSDEQTQWTFATTEDAFARDVIARSHDKPVVVDFWAPWCGPCTVLGPMLEALVDERAGAVLLAKVNVDEAPGIAAEYGVRSIPDVRAFRNGKVVLGFVGALPEAHLRSFLDRIVPSEADKQIEEARAHETTDPAAADRIYRDVLQREPNHDVALLGLARVLLARGQDGEAAPLLDRATPGGEQGAELERLRGLLALRTRARDCGDETSLRRQLQAEPNSAEFHYRLGCVLAADSRYKDALDEMLAAARLDKKLARAQVKEAMVQVFHVVGVRSALADEYRDQLTQLLY